MPGEKTPAKQPIPDKTTLVKTELPPKAVLEKKLESQDLLFEEDATELSSRYARNLSQLLSQEVSNGNARTN